MPEPPIKWLIDQHGPSRPAASWIACRIGLPAASLPKQTGRVGLTVEPLAM